MATGSLLARLGLWRLTRSRPALRLYSWLRARGVSVAQLDLLERPASPDGTERPVVGAVETPEGIEVMVHAVGEQLPDGLTTAPVAPEDTVIVARSAPGGASVGHVCCSRRPVFVPELDRVLHFPGVYCWRLHVTPPQRGRGIGRSLVARALQWTSASTEAPIVSALVAPDNVPSRRLFEGLGFRPATRHTSVRILGRRWDRRRRLRSDR